MGKYLIAVDQSTQGTKALLFDETGTLIAREDLPHEQKISADGWVSHNPEEIYQNTVTVMRKLIENNKVPHDQLAGIGLCNQRETAVMWDRETGKPLADAVVWQCARATDVCKRGQIKNRSAVIEEKTGLKLSPYFTAAKITWLIENTEGATEKSEQNQLCHGTMDSFLIYRLTGGKEYRTDYSNAARTMLFNIVDLKWDEEICSLFGIQAGNLPTVTDSDACFGTTNLEGYLDQEIPIHAVLGDSNGALFGQGCVRPGMVKATYGTGSSIMMNIGDEVKRSAGGLVTSIGWKRAGKVSYVMEGNLNYTGAVITWLKDDLQLIKSPKETEQLAQNATKDDSLYLVPSFSGLGAPFWDSQAKAMICGMDRTTRKPEIVRAALECIAYQINDIVETMKTDAGIPIEALRVDGGPTKNQYLMNFQSDIIGTEVNIPAAEELSGIGAAYMAGEALGLWDEKILTSLKRTSYMPKMQADVRRGKVEGWKSAVGMVLHH